MATPPLGTPLVDGFVNGLKRTALAAEPLAAQTPSSPSVASARGPDAPPDVDPAALQLQAELSSTRQRLGAVLEQKEGLGRRVGSDGVLEATHAEALTRLEGEERGLRASLAALEATEATQPTGQVERARFEVFHERLDALERSRGPEVATRLARQSWYNDRKFNVAGGTTAATEAQLLQAGFPSSPNMRSPADERIDMGHVACALDWQVNPSPTHRLVVNLEEVTLTGDLAAAAQAMVARGITAEEALAQQASAPDLLGDLDGLNLAARLAEQPRTSSVAGVLREYYADGNPPRLEEFASHSRFFVRDASGAPGRDAAGGLTLDAATLEGAVETFAGKLLSIGYGGGDGAEERLAGAVKDVVAAWAAQSGLVLV